MASDTTDSSGRADRPTTTIASTAVRLAADLLIVTGWVLLLTLLFLQQPWPQWAFYALLIVGIGLYVTVTATWRSTERSP
ncbi:hypothetical protein [Natronorubrum thiooxidans]|uniref:DUF8119 domain-containing protein n=1 Tax=Natronorubrum thiooxidans TaxID=308853 RepID=A0A1N7H192_9EURY|nr:hypothetical protein [Natronorubrum thiooxidans]SIS18586.1 hypothetical protein SAMN05421752_12038 [Natronorubrum thiooxidans]